MAYPANAKLWRSINPLAGECVACNKAPYIVTEFKARLDFTQMPRTLLDTIRQSVEANYLATDALPEAVIMEALCKELGVAPLSYIGKMKANIYLCSTDALNELHGEIKALRGLTDMDYESMTTTEGGFRVLRLWKKAEKKRADGARRKTPIVKPQFTAAMATFIKYLRSDEEQRYRADLLRLVTRMESVNLTMRKCG